MNETPAVSCMCLTYGRPQVLAEAVQSFLQQNYAGPKELVVLNDLDCQTLRFEHP
ncbi:MAG: glycosyltransferase family A protein [Verrucomicrobia bacterium]|nr:glycosyltransferase family A protein [Verrucomicrobiota bacterium]